jgi:hypothetical protein
MQRRRNVLARGAVGCAAALLGLTTLAGCDRRGSLVELRLAAHPSAVWSLADLEVVDQNPYQDIKNPVSFISFRPAALQPARLGLQFDGGKAGHDGLSVRLGDAAVVGDGQNSIIATGAWFTSQLSRHCWMLPLPSISHNQARFSQFRLDPAKRRLGNAAGCPHLGGGEQYLLARHAPGGEYDALIRCGDGATVACRMTIFRNGWKVEITFHRHYIEMQGTIEAAVLKYITDRTRVMTALE